jgi:hypothetical protein
MTAFRFRETTRMLNTRDSGSDMELLDIKRALAALDVELKLCRLIYLLRKYGTDQPRVPAGSPEGGQWTSGGGGGGAEPASDAESVLTEEGRSAAEGDKAPQIPKERPATAQERTRAVKTIARSPMGRVGLILEAASWVKEYAPVIWSYFDSPRSLEELQSNVGDPAPGYDIDHIVEQTSAEQDGFPRSQINAPENLARVPRLRHWEINAWYQTSNKEFDGLSPRDYLRGRPWDERAQVGLRALIQFGVLVP